MEKIKSNKDKRFRSFLMSALRKASRFWEPTRECLQKARLERGIYKCAICSKITPAKEIRADHIEPVIPINGFETWDEVINRLFCEVSGFQAICKPCHDEKTKKENAQRRFIKKEKAILNYNVKKRKSKNEKKD
jgi:hypothetical protein